MYLISFFCGVTDFTIHLHYIFDIISLNSSCLLQMLLKFPIKTMFLSTDMSISGNVPGDDWLMNIVVN